MLAIHSPDGYVEDSNHAHWNCEVWKKQLDQTTDEHPAVSEIRLLLRRL